MYTTVPFRPAVLVGNPVIVFIQRSPAQRGVLCQAFPLASAQLARHSFVCTIFGRTVHLPPPCRPPLRRPFRTAPWPLYIPGPVRRTDGQPGLRSAPSLRARPPVRGLCMRMSSAPPRGAMHLDARAGAVHASAVCGQAAAQPQPGQAIVMAPCLPEETCEGMGPARLDCGGMVGMHLDCRHAYLIQFTSLRPAALRPIGAPGLACTSHLHIMPCSPVRLRPRLRWASRCACAWAGQSHQALALGSLIRVGWSVLRTVVDVGCGSSPPTNCSRSREYKAV